MWASVVVGQSGHHGSHCEGILPGPFGGNSLGSGGMSQRGRAESFVVVGILIPLPILLVEDSAKDGLLDGLALLHGGSASHVFDTSDAGAIFVVIIVWLALLILSAYGLNVLDEIALAIVRVLIGGVSGLVLLFGHVIKMDMEKNFRFPIESNAASSTIRWSSARPGRRESHGRWQRICGHLAKRMSGDALTCDSNSRRGF